MAVGTIIARTITSQPPRKTATPGQTAIWGPSKRPCPNPGARPLTTDAMMSSHAIPTPHQSGEIERHGRTAKADVISLAEIQAAPKGLGLGHRHVPGREHLEERISQVVLADLSRIA